MSSPGVLHWVPEEREREMGKTEKSFYVSRFRKSLSCWYTQKHTPDESKNGFSWHYSINAAWICPAAVYDLSIYFKTHLFFFSQVSLTHTESCPSGLGGNRSHILLFRASICPNTVAMENKPCSWSVGSSQTGWKAVFILTKFEKSESVCKWSHWFFVVSYC